MARGKRRGGGGDPRRRLRPCCVGEGSGGLFGRGLYFAANSSKADLYAGPLDRRFRWHKERMTVILAAVNCGNMYQAKATGQQWKKPPPPDAAAQAAGIKRCSQRTACTSFFWDHMGRTYLLSVCPQLVEGACLLSPHSDQVSIGAGSDARQWTITSILSLTRRRPCQLPQSPTPTRRIVSAALRSLRRCLVLDCGWSPDSVCAPQKATAAFGGRGPRIEAKPQPASVALCQQSLW